MKFFLLNCMRAGLQKVKKRGSCSHICDLIPISLLSGLRLICKPFYLMQVFWCFARQTCITEAGSGSYYFAFCCMGPGATDASKQKHIPSCMFSFRYDLCFACVFPFAEPFFFKFFYAKNL